jgi:hypothetical protein
MSTRAFLTHQSRGLSIAILILGVAGCGGQAGPSFISKVEIGQPTPGAGATIQTVGTTPGAFINKNSGLLAIPITIVSNREVSFAELNVYLLTNEPGTEYCGQNLPDMPMWGPYKRGQVERLTITGFQVFRLPCQVVGIRAMFHNRIGGVLTPPRPDQTLAEATLPVNYTIR